MWSAHPIEFDPNTSGNKLSPIYEALKSHQSRERWHSEARLNYRLYVIGIQGCESVLRQILGASGVGHYTYRAGENRTPKPSRTPKVNLGLNLNPGMTTGIANNIVDEVE